MAEEKKYWQKIGGGGLTLPNGKRIKSGDKFYEFESNISPAFRKSLKLLEENKKVEKVEKEPVVVQPKPVKKPVKKTVSRTK